MKQFLANKLVDKKVLILGYGREGASTYRLVRNYFPTMQLTIADKNSSIHELLSIFNDNNLTIITGDSYLENVLSYDVIIKSPGISLKDYSAIYSSGKVTSQTDLFLQQYYKQTIGITGTKGKSTVSSLIHHILEKSNYHSILCGNIGIPVFDSVNQITSDTIIVTELSSHQLEFIEVAPHIAILLNLFQEHLDHYTSLQAYHLAKANIYLKQKAGSFFIFHEEDENINHLFESLKPQATLCPFSSHSIYDKFMGKSNLKGSHNALNINAAAIVAHIVGVDDYKIEQAVSSFKALPHRMEYVGEIKGIHFYNDSIATIPEAAIQSVLALQDVDTLILGGFDRGIDYTPLVDFVGVSEIKTLIFLGKAGERMFNAIIEKDIFKGILLQVNTLQEAVNSAFKYTAQSRICLLSPAAASYDQFKNFEERGDIFRKLIRGTI